MASSNLKAKSLDRTALYYGKFEYRVVVNSPNMFYSYSCKTIDEYKNRIIEICEDYDNNMYRWRKKPIVEDWEYELIENIINLEQTYKIKKDYTLRRENTTCCIYTSNLKLVNEVLGFAPNATINRVNLMPTGVMLFKRTPPAKYRVYMSNNKMPADFKEELLSYIARTPDVTPSNAFYDYLQRTTKFHYQSYLWDKYYVDYNDDKNLMMMTLMFPGMIGKKFKLEQK